MEAALTFEQGPIRPPSEAGSLLIRATRNCPWNRCVFCGTYKGTTFSRRSVEEIKADIDTVRTIVDRIEAISREAGETGQLTRQGLARVLQDYGLPDSFRSVAYWLACGGNTVFLQDANSLMLSTDSLLAVLEHIRQTFPQVTRVTSYARGSTLKSKSLEDFIRLRGAGLSRLHVGMESGSDRVLKLIRKGVTSEQVIEGGKRVVQSGISLCLYVMPGMGGTELSLEHAIETARVINAVNPHFVRFRSLYVRRSGELIEMVREGKFTPPGEDDMVLEIRTMIERLEGIESTIVSDHILNLLEEVEGTLPRDKQQMLDVIDRYLSLPEEDRLMFQLGRRSGALRNLDDLNEPRTRSRLLEAKRHIDRELPGGVPEYIDAIKKQFI